MKKSQVLAALALAMALGVVAPVASTFAATSSQEQCNEIYEDVEDAIKKIGNQPNVATWGALEEAMDDLNAAFKPSVSALRSALTATPSTGDTIEPVYKIVKYIIDNGGQVNGHAATINDFAGKTYAQIAAYADDKNTTVTFPADAAGNTAGLKAVVDTATTGTDALMQGFANAVIAQLTTLKLDTNLTNDDAASVLAYVNGLSVYTKTHALYMELQKAWDGAANARVCASTDDKKVTQATADLKAALAAYNGTTDNKGDAGDAQKPTTPDTGANTASEESATASVSILSGVASVVTAAGVVIRKAFRK